MTKIYVPAPGRRIQMPGNRPDWPVDGQAIDPLDNYQRRLVADGDLILKTKAAGPRQAEQRRTGKGAKP